MNGDYLVDTNIIVAFLNGEPAVQAKFAASIIYLPIIALGELYFGAEKSARKAVNVTKVDTLAARNRVLEIDLLTAKAYGEIKAGLRIKGRPIPDNDMWIAAIAQRYRLPLAARDAHFSHVTGLVVETW